MTSARRTVLGSTALFLVLGGLLVQSPAPAAPARVTKLAVTSPGTGGVTRSVTAVRDSIAADGRVTQVDKRTVKVDVSATTNLRGRQEVTVSWSGAHPTGGIAGDVNSAAGANQEYPFVLLQCRGVDSTTVAVAKRIRPETCWTQTWAERYRSDNETGYPAWRSDAFAPAAERGESVDAPAAADRPSRCGRPALAERWLPMVAANGTSYAGGTGGCAGQAPESSNIDSSGFPSNATYGITGLDGRGSTQFSVWTDQENASLGCTSSIPCSLVAVPIVGVSCDAYGTKLPAAQRPDAENGPIADEVCHQDDVFNPGQLAISGTLPNQASAGALWWSASNWRNRISVPLSFAVSPNVCSIVSSQEPLAIYGSSLMNEATAQWQPKFCTTKSLFPFVHVQTADSAARILLENGTVKAAFSSGAPDGGFVRPVVQAPIAVTGFAISYVIDDAGGERYRKLRMTPRLLAKLLTESYPGNALVRNSYQALEKNPLNISEDPEFRALNPGLPQYDNREAAATLLSLSADTDMLYALTSYINSDPEARAWLDGERDPWGMKVNPSYVRVPLPVYSWPLLDDYQPPQSYIDGGSNPCYSSSPSPYLSLIANPTSLVSTIVLNMQYAISNVSLECPNGDRNDPSTLRLQTQGRQQPGFRFVLGIVPLSAVSRFSLTAAALQSGPADPIGADDGTGRAAEALNDRSYVSGNDAGLKAGAALFRADAKARTWSVDYDALRTAKGVKAYPGTVPVYTDVPTVGLSRSTASRLAQFLRYNVTEGQVRGLANGDLPPGYLPLTKANGLAALAGYTRRAADAVEAQQGETPPLVAVPSTPGGGEPTTGPTTPSGTQAGETPVVLDPVVPGDAPTRNPGSNAVAGNAPVSTEVFRTVGEHSALGRWGLPLLILLGLVLAPVGAVLRFVPNASASLRTGLRSLPRRVGRS